jgi:general stress protein YciG
VTWVRIDDEFARHPKVVQAGPLGMAMQVAGLCYCNQYLTDGFIPDAVVPGLLSLDGLGMRMWKGEMIGGGEDASWQFVADDLEDADLWIRVDGGYRIHDYHDYQPSKAEVLALKEARKDAGRKGGKASSRAKDKQVLEQTVSNGSSKTEAKLNPVPVPVEDSRSLSGASESSAEPPAPRSGTGSAPAPMNVPRAWAAFVKGHAWDEVLIEDQALAELKRLRAHPGATGHISDASALEQWHAEYERRYAPSHPEVAA